jgi:undecaprenyl-diphosphatase
LALALTLCTGVASAEGGFLSLDHRLNLDNSGLWSRGSQRTIQYGAALVVVGGAFWEGRDTRLGRTFFKAADAMVLADATALVGKRVFRRQRPMDGNDPSAWGGASSDRSFPSGEVTHITAIVTPFIAEYHKDYPAIWALATLPVVVGVGRLKSQEHWQTDVLAGMALGVGMGLYAHNRSESLSIGLLPDGLTVGYKTKF